MTCNPSPADILRLNHNGADYGTAIPTNIRCGEIHNRLWKMAPNGLRRLSAVLACQERYANPQGPRCLAEKKGHGKGGKIDEYDD